MWKTGIKANKSFLLSKEKKKKKKQRIMVIDKEEMKFLIHL